jgi:murein DD-endopeptidase MepM/ murein hydrolase activator NlpD
VKDVQPQTTPQSRAGTAEMYTVVRGDTLSGIADTERVDGGWHGLYAANRTTVGQRSRPDPAGPAAQPARQGGPTAHTTTKPGVDYEVVDHQVRPKKKASSETTEKVTHKKTTSHSLVAPVNAPIGTAYHASGSSWSKGYHTGVDFLVPTGTSVKAIETGTVVSAGWAVRTATRW